MGSAERKTERRRGEGSGQGREIVRRLTSCILPGRRRLYRAPLHVQRAPSAPPVHVRARTYGRVVLAGPPSPPSRVSPVPQTTPSRVARVTSRRCTGSRRRPPRQHGADNSAVVFALDFSILQYKCTQKGWLTKIPIDVERRKSMTNLRQTYFPNNLLVFNIKAIS
jgi:hypothetical protein